MFVDCFQLGLEKAWFTNFLKYILTDDRPNTTHKLLIMWATTLEFVWTTGFPSSEKISFLPHPVLHYSTWLLLKVINAIVVVIFCSLCWCRCFRSPERWQFSSNGLCFHWSLWHHYRWSIFVGEVGGRARTMDWLPSLSPHLPFHPCVLLCPKCHICITWLLNWKCLLCRLRLV